MSARRLFRNFIVVGCGIAVAVPVLAQDRRPAAPPKPDPQVTSRYQLVVMEGVLEAAVQHGARTMSRQLQAAMPQMLLMGGTARARGFRLDGYGVFFDVDVPAMRQSLVWSWRMLERDNGSAAGALESLKNFAKSVNDPVQKKEVEQAIRRLEIQVAPFPSVADSIRAGDPAGRDGQTTTVVKMPTSVAPGVPAGASAPMVASAARAGEPIDDPSEAYTTAVKEALIDAMLGFSQALDLGAEEWLTVAARDGGDSRMASDDPFDSVTIFIRIKGSDLHALHASRITREEARKRVEVREY